MIITVSKPFNEVLDSLKNHTRLFLVGCAACATKCQTGNEEAVKKMAAELEKAGKEIAGFAVLDTPCDQRIVRKDLVRSEAAVKAEALLVLACGAGIGAIEKVMDTPLVPALNPVFVGTTERIGVYHEYCAVCGACILGRTGGICPLTRCAKGMANGPCGGVIDGKCEVDAERDCAWALIFEKLRKTGREKDVFGAYFPPRSFARPRSIKK
ncbi:MAG: methylenetetrahydrofolate reductase C-terminal domain-containing protein [Endomicrobiales bacterium]